MTVKLLYHWFHDFLSLKVVKAVISLLIPFLNSSAADKADDGLALHGAVTPLTAVGVVGAGKVIDVLR